jgi:hypothetical protein
MTTDQTTTRLVAARPDVECAPADVTSAQERDALLRSIMRQPPAAHAPQRHLAPGLIAAVVLSAVIGGLLVIDNDRAAREVAGPASASTPARVVLDEIDLAMTAAAEGVVHIETDFGNGVLWATWLDETTGRWRSQSRTLDGQPIYDHQVDARDDGTTVTVVSYNDRAWWSHTAPEERDQARLYLTPEEIRSQLRDGTLRELGRHGDLIHLRGDGVRKAPATFTPTVDLWVDSTSYLPTRSTSQVDGKPAVTSTYTWLLRSDENVRQTEVVIPPSFVHLAGAPAQTDPAGQD